MINYKINLRIADTIIQLQSRFSLENPTKEEQKLQTIERFDNFFCRVNQSPDILIDIEIVDKLPNVSNAKPVFITYHFQDKSENWRLLKKGNTYIYKCPLEDKKQIMLVNKTFDRVTAYLLPRKNKLPEMAATPISGDKSKVWNITDIIYDFLQVLLINYLGRRNQGIFTHSVGIKDEDDSGLLFSGKSGAGKSTTARLWYKHSRAIVLNDDRIIIRKLNGKFFIYGSPWHGEFSDYLVSRIESAPLKRIFFIHHSPKNIATRISSKQAFNLLYPVLFPTFWNRNCLENIAAFCDDLVKNVPCSSLGFVNNKRVINFVRRRKDA